MKEKLFEEQLQENYLVREAIFHLKKFNLDFLIEQAKQRSYFSYETLVGVVDFLTEENSLNENVEYHHIVFVKSILKKMINSPLENWASPDLRRHYLIELDVRLDLYCSDFFKLEMDLEKKRESTKKVKEIIPLSLEDFEKEIDKE